MQSRGGALDELGSANSVLRPHAWDSELRRD